MAGDGEGYVFTVETDPTLLSVEDQPQPSLEVRNTFNLAQVSVSKSVESEATGIDGEPIAYGPFEVTLACLWDQQQVTAAEPMTQQIADGETATWTELPEDAECTVTETDTAGAESTTIVVTEGGEAGDPATANSSSANSLRSAPSGSPVAMRAPISTPRIDASPTTRAVRARRFP